MAKRRSSSVGGQTYLANRPDVWRQMFPVDRLRARFVADVLGSAGPRVLDVGCATGDLCATLADAGLDPDGRRHQPVVRPSGDRQVPPSAVPGWRHARASFSCALRWDRLRRFHPAVCHLESRSRADTPRVSRRSSARRYPFPRRLNASALVARRPFLRRTVHRFPRLGLTATIDHAIDETNQVLIEQVTWTNGRRRHSDPESRLRLLFPQELTHFLTGAGFRSVEIRGDFRRNARELQGRRMVVHAARA